jgi:carbon-monoxide dehydrogenase medium subunit
LKPLEFSSPASLEEALRLLATPGSTVGLLSGGTDLIIQHRAGRRELDHMVDLKKIPELNVLSFDPGSGLRLGAAVPCARLGAYEPAQRFYAALVEGAELIGSTQIQSRASVGGNVCNGSPAADAICPLIVLGAVGVLAGPGGRRELPAVALMTGPGQTALKPGEILVELRLPPPPPRSASAYLRFIPRNEMDIAVASAATFLALDADGATVRSAAVALGAVGPTPILAEAAGAALVGSRLEPAAVAAAARAAEAAARPISDVRGPAEYRRHLAGVLTRRTVALAAERIRAGAGAAR